MSVAFIVSSKALLALLAALVLILLDTFFGALVAWVKGEFSWKRLPDFLQKAVVGEVFGLVLLGLLTTVQVTGVPDDAKTFYDSSIVMVVGFYYAAATAVIARHLKELKDKVSSIFPGVIQKE